MPTCDAICNELQKCPGYSWPLRAARMHSIALLGFLTWLLLYQEKVISLLTSGKHEHVTALLFKLVYVSTHKTM